MFELYYIQSHVFKHSLVDPMIDLDLMIDLIIDLENRLTSCQLAELLAETQFFPLQAEDRQGK